MANAVDRLLDDPEGIRALRQRAYAFVRAHLPMEPAGALLAALAAELPQPAHSSARTPALQKTQLAPPPSAPARRRFRRTAARALRGRRRGPQALEVTPSYARASPRVSVLLAAAHGDARQTVEALASVAASLFDELEALVLIDGSDDRLAPALRSFLHEHPSLPAKLLSEPVGRGLGHRRNLLIEQARGEHVLVLDASARIFPSTVTRLVAALDEDPAALFCYPMVAVFEQDKPVQLLGSLPWEPERLARENWIDGVTLVRRARLLELGCYSTDPRLAGVEDLDLWRRCAQAGGRGVQVAQVLGWRLRDASRASADGENGARTGQAAGDPREGLPATASP